jgi:hypothetical protein
LKVVLFFIFCIHQHSSWTSVFCLHIVWVVLFFYFLHAPALILDECFLHIYFVSSFIFILFSACTSTHPGQVFSACIFCSGFIFYFLHALALILDECFLLAYCVSGSIFILFSAYTSTHPGWVFSACIFWK